jgi:hypothetical protein
MRKNKRAGENPCSGTLTVLKKRSDDYSKNRLLREELHIIVSGIPLLVKNTGRTS